jgi:hypothetical protein
MNTHMNSISVDVKMSKVKEAKGYFPDQDMAVVKALDKLYWGMNELANEFNGDHPGYGQWYFESAIYDLDSVLEDCRKISRSPLLESPSDARDKVLAPIIKEVEDVTQRFKEDLPKMFGDGDYDDREVNDADCGYDY